MAFPSQPKISSAAENLIVNLLTDADRRLGKNSPQEIKDHQFFEGIEFDHIRSLRAPYVPQISETDPTDTSNFDSYSNLDNGFNSMMTGRRTIEDYVNGDRTDFSGTNLDHAFFEFTFRRFFDSSNIPYRNNGSSLALSLPKGQSQQERGVNPNSPGATVVTIDCATNANSTSALSVTSSSTTTSTGATSSSGITIACPNGSNLVRSDEKNSAPGDLHLSSSCQGSNKSHSNYNSKTNNNQNNSNNPSAGTIATATGNNGASSTGPGGTPVYV